MEKGNMRGFLCGLLALLLALTMSAPTVSGLTCGEAIVTLMPCQSFLVGTVKLPSSPCCVATQRVSSEASSKEVRQMLCKCFKQAASVIGVKPEVAKTLPDMCKVAVPVPIDPNLDCNKIN